MPLLPIIMPQLGESIAEATLLCCRFKIGDYIKVDTEIFEVETNKAVMGVTAPCSGFLRQIIASNGESYPVGATLGFLEITAEDSINFTHTSPLFSEELSQNHHSSAQKNNVEPTVKGLPVPAHTSGASFLSPRMKARMTDLGLHAADLAGIAGSGAGGRVTIEDLEHFLNEIERNNLSPASSMRVAVADAMRRSWTRPLATVVLPINLDPIMHHRQQQTVKAGLSLYLLRALAITVADMPTMAGRLIGDRIIHPRSIDIGFAVEADDGVLVPVIRNADQFPLNTLIERYNCLIKLAKSRRLSGNDTGSSIATITNYGVFGLTVATPIPLPEQTLLLGIGAAQITPHWDSQKNAFIPINQAQFTLSFDHRVIDGGAAGRLLNRISELISDPKKL